MEEKICPKCKTTGRKVTVTTPRSHLQTLALERWEEGSTTRFCKNPTCEVVYFQLYQMYLTEELNKLVYQKSSDTDRLVCYCFQHSVKSIRHEVRANGNTQVYNEIAQKCKKGLDSCASKNPQGTCCLGNVKAVIQTALVDFDNTNDLDEIDREPSCCSDAKKDD